MKSLRSVLPLALGSAFIVLLSTSQPANATFSASRSLDKAESADEVLRLNSKLSKIWTHAYKGEYDVASTLLTPVTQESAKWKDRSVYSTCLTYEAWIHFGHYRLAKDVEPTQALKHLERARDLVMQALKELSGVNSKEVTSNRGFLKQIEGLLKQAQEATSDRGDSKRLVQNSRAATPFEQLGSPLIGQTSSFLDLQSYCSLYGANDRCRKVISHRRHDYSPGLPWRRGHLGKYLYSNWLFQKARRIGIEGASINLADGPPPEVDSVVLRWDLTGAKPGMVFPLLDASPEDGKASFESVKKLEFQLFQLDDGFHDEENLQALDKNVVATLPKFPNLEEVVLSGCTWNQEGHGKNFMPRFLKALRSVRNLKVLDVSPLTLSDSMKKKLAENLTNWPHLRKLAFGAQITSFRADSSDDEGFSFTAARKNGFQRVIENFSHLKEFSELELEHVDEASLKALIASIHSERLSKLKTLVVRLDPSAEPMDLSKLFPALSKLPNLNEFGLRADATIEDAYLLAQTLPSMGSLRSLYLCFDSDVAVPRAFIEELEKTPHRTYPQIEFLSFRPDFGTWKESESEEAHLQSRLRHFFPGVLGPAKFNGPRNKLGSSEGDRIQWLDISKPEGKESGDEESRDGEGDSSENDESDLVSPVGHD